MPSHRNDLASIVAEALLTAEILGVAVIEVHELDGIVTLKGTVSSLETKVLAEAITIGQAGVVEVVNELVVSVHRDGDRFFTF